jgi:hypothetical protein
LGPFAGGRRSFKVDERRTAEEVIEAAAREVAGEREDAPFEMEFEGGEGDPDTGRRGGGVLDEVVDAILQGLYLQWLLRS